MTADRVLELLAAACTAGAVGSWAARALHPLKSPRLRMAVYLEVPRASLGGKPGASPGPLLAREATRRVLGPLFGSGARLFGSFARLGTPAQLDLALRRAGLDMTPEEYRREHLRWLVATPVALGLVGILTGRAALVPVFFAAGIFAGARRLPDRVKACTRRRNERMRSDLPTVASVLALKIDNNKSLTVSVMDLTSQGSGPVVEDLRRAVHLVSAGYGEAAAFELLATETAEPAAARLYRFLCAASSGGLDLSRALLDQASELRAQRREEVERQAARRQISLVVPSLVFMAPVLFVFLLAPLPQLLFGK